jgi:hypothetical protein
MTKMLRRNRITERAGVNAARTFFEGHGCTFVEVDLGNDYGKDAYVDFGDGTSISPVCAALQIKSGASYRTKSGYQIPLDGHDVEMWRNSTVPVLGIVFDEDDCQLRWVNISKFLNEAGDKLSSIPVRRSAILVGSRLSDVKDSVREASSVRKSEPLARLCETEPSLQHDAVFECFSLGQTDGRYLIGLRYLLPYLALPARRLAITALAYLTPHPDVFWCERNRVRRDIIDEVTRQFKWKEEEIVLILESFSFEELDRGQLGQSAFMLLVADEDIRNKLRNVIKKNVDLNAAIAISLSLAGDDAFIELSQLLQAAPVLRESDFVEEIAQIIAESGWLELF